MHYFISYDLIPRLITPIQKQKHVSSISGIVA